MKQKHLIDRQNKGQKRHIGRIYNYKEKITMHPQTVGFELPQKYYNPPITLGFELPHNEILTMNKGNFTRYIIYNTAFLRVQNE